MSKRIMELHEEAEASLREVMSAYPTGVTVVAGRDDDGVPYGLTVNSFTSVSLDPPLILVCIAHASTSHGRLIAASSFSVNVLASDQERVARRFAAEPSEGRFDDLGWAPGSGGAPILEGVSAWLECSAERVIRGGDHSILLGRVEQSAVTDRPALLFHRGRLGSTSS